jgi:hypothetical protein
MARVDLLGMLVFAAACSAPPPATEEQRQLAERRLLAPFLEGKEVGCGELFVELTPNFHPNVGQPAIDKTRHTVDRQTGDGFVETVWTNVAGTPASSLGVTIGEPQQLTDTGHVLGQQTRFRVVNQLRIRVWEGVHPMTLNATAGGAVVLVQSPGGKPEEVKRFVVVDGVLQQP